MLVKLSIAFLLALGASPACACSNASVAEFLAKMAAPPAADIQVNAPINGVAFDQIIITEYNGREGVWTARAGCMVFGMIVPAEMMPAAQPTSAPAIAPVGPTASR